MSKSDTRILVVDDEPALGEIMCMALILAGFEVVFANNAIEALQYFRAQTFDVVLLDEMMPGSKGHELAVCLKGYEPSVPVILASAYPQKGFPGVDQIILKPISPEALKHLILSVLPKKPQAAR